MFWVWLIRRREEEIRRQAEEEEKRRKAEERERRIEAGEDPAEVDRELYGIIPESELAAAEGGEVTGGKLIVLELESIH